MPILLAVLLGVVSGPALAGGDQNLIRKMCMAAFSTAMNDAGETPPPGMGEFTCGCFLDQLGEGAGFDAAQTSCKQEAARRYGY